ncbi:hypothetical protein ACI3L1_15700 [Deinococcus sp. SM5_A1]|uniref:hypothetical protein n=1 Tax=Deinococcus sp. SM5_A1 TaxID=3379094 RepID=UPI003857FE65
MTQTLDQLINTRPMPRERAALALKATRHLLEAQARMSRRGVLAAQQIAEASMQS